MHKKYKDQEIQVRVLEKGFEYKNKYYMSPQRINQITSLLLLSPRIQEEKILQNDSCLFKIPEYKLRTITDEFDWNNQHVMWQKLTPKIS